MDPKDEEAKNKKKKPKRKRIPTALLSLPLQTRLFLFVQRWFLYGKRTTVGFRKARMCNSHIPRRPYLRKSPQQPYRALNRP
jgi:hypothetical protein